MHEDIEIEKIIQPAQPPKTDELPRGVMFFAWIAVCALVLAFTGTVVMALIALFMILYRAAVGAN